MRLTVLGGGGFRVPLIYRALSGGRFENLITELCLYDVDAGRLAAMESVLADLPPVTPAGGGTPPAVSTTTSLDAALEGSDVVFAAIRPGGTAGRVLDERIAMAHGLLGQETVGAGGISYALRSIPAMLRIAERLRVVAPDAWLVNFTNPAGMVTEALIPLLGGRVVGICDSPAGLIRRAAAACGLRRPGMGGIGSLAGVDYAGLNHLGWLRGLTVDGVDHLPGLLADSERVLSFEEGRVFGAEFLRMLGSIPNEYLFYYYFHREAASALSGAAETRGEFIAAQQRDLFARLAQAPNPFALWESARRSREEGYLAEARGAEDPRDEEDLAGGGYEQVALRIMAAVLGGAEADLVLNVRNGGALPQLPPDVVVEVPARMSAGGALPLNEGVRLTSHQLGLMSELKAVEQATVAAAVHGDRDCAVRAFTLHPLVDSAHAARTVLRSYEDAFPALRELWNGP